MNLRRIRTAFNKKSSPAIPPTPPEECSDEVQEQDAPLVGESIEVELERPDTSLTAVMMLEVFQPNDDGFCFQGYFDCPQSDDEFRSQMEGLLSDRQFALGFERDGLIIAGMCVVQDYTVDDYDSFNITGIFYTDVISEVKPDVPFSFDKYIQDVSSTDDNELDIWDALDKKIAHKKNVLDRK